MPVNCDFKIPKNMNNGTIRLGKYRFHLDEGQDFFQGLHAINKTNMSCSITVDLQPRKDGGIRLTDNKEGWVFNSKWYIEEVSHQIEQYAFYMPSPDWLRKHNYNKVVLTKKPRLEKILGGDKWSAKYS